MLLMRLQPSLAASTGSACHSGVIGTSHVLQAIGLNDEAAKGSIRFSYGRYTTEKDVIMLLELLAKNLQVENSDSLVSEAV